MSIENQRIFPDTPISKEEISDLLLAVKNIPKEILGDTWQEAQEIITGWVINLWNGMLFILESADFPQNFSTEEKNQFKSMFIKELKNFVSHPDHGIVHSYFVYDGMLYLSNLDKDPIEKGSDEDKQAQLLALLHDAIQELPFAIITKTSTKAKVHTQRSEKSYMKNNHARIMGSLIRLYGGRFGYTPHMVAEAAFGIRQHDSSYKGEYHNSLNKVLKYHNDADKTCGSSENKDITAITIGMLKRNYEVNRGSKGSYLLRTELDTTYRDKFEYGHRGWSDCIAVIRKELQMDMYTEAGKEIARQRREEAKRQIFEVYGYFFDLTENYIKDNIIGILGREQSDFVMTVTGLDQEEKPLEPIQDVTELLAKFQKLYDTPIQLKLEENVERKLATKYNTATDARGLKIHVVDTITGKDVYLDPSIARFCLKPWGREEFLREIGNAFADLFEPEPEHENPKPEI